METTARTKTAAVGATLIFALIAAFTMVAGPTSASAQTVLSIVAPDMGAGIIGTQIDIGSIDVVYAGSGASVEGSTLNAPDWNVFGGAINGVDITAHIDSWVPGLHLILLLVAVEFPSGCVVTLHGPYTINNSGGTIYSGAPAAGAYLFADCTPAEEALVNFELGGSPSSTPVTVRFDIQHL